jgi:phage-related protein
MAIVSVSYNSNSFQTTASAAATILTKDILFEDIPEKSLLLKQDTIRDGFSVIDTRYSQKLITLRGWLISDTPTNLRTHIDNVKGYLNEDEKSLNIETYGGSGVYRRYICSCQDFSIPSEHWMTTQVPYEATFLAEPFGTATTTTTINLNSDGAITSSPYNENISIVGTYNTKPTITITVNSETSMTVLKLDNTTVGDWIQITPSGGFSASDILVIDCENETIELNGLAIDFTGVFPAFKAGTNSLTLTITASAFNLTGEIVYYPTYL